MNSYFEEFSYEELLSEIKYVYKSDERPWIIGYSGGKDSTTVVELVYEMLLSLKPHERSKNVYIVSSDTLIENPLIKIYLSKMNSKLGEAAARDGLPIVSCMVTPEFNNTFWTNIIGKGLPTPRMNGTFRWCTDRLKIKPSADKIKEIMAEEKKEVIVLLGVRKAESIARKRRIEGRELATHKLNRHETIQDAYVYNPIVELTTDDVWKVLLEHNSGKTPWGSDNSELVSLYSDADSGECPFAGMSNSGQTQSCGQSRFGCWCCTVVKEDKSLNGFIKAGHRELIPLAEFRSWLMSIRDKDEYREKKHRDGTVYADKHGNKLRAKIAEVAFYSRDFADFLQNCTASGIEYVYKPSNKVKLKFRLSGEGQQKFTRADTLGEDYTAERIAEQIEQIQKAHAVTERLAEKKAPEKTVAPKSEYVYKPLSDDEFFSAFGVHLDEVDEPTTTTAKPTEIKAPEKKEDVWAEIRGMRKADTIIADLESGGIASLREFRSFFWNFKHDDDHTDKLSELKTKIKAIDKLIKMMKQRSKHFDTYKEYRECSAFRQKSFRKKNADAIDSYEQADQYIKKHIKDYAVDGKAPKRSELEKMLTDLKMEYNALVPEHNSFLKKKATAAPYLKTVRTYLENQKKQERDRQYRERKLTQQKKKDTLE